MAPNSFRPFAYCFRRHNHLRLGHELLHKGQDNPWSISSLYRPYSLGWRCSLVSIGRKDFCFCWWWQEIDDLGYTNHFCFQAQLFSWCSFCWNQLCFIQPQEWVYSCHWFSRQGMNETRSLNLVYRLLHYGTWETLNTVFTLLKTTKMKSSSWNGRTITKRFLLLLPVTAVLIFGIFLVLAKNKVQKTQKTGHLNSCLFMEATPTRFLISAGTRMILGLFALLLKTTSAKFGKW